MARGIVEGGVISCGIGREVVDGQTNAGSDVRGEAGTSGAGDAQRLDPTALIGAAWTLASRPKTGFEGVERNVCWCCIGVDRFDVVCDGPTF